MSEKPFGPFERAMRRLTAANLEAGVETSDRPSREARLAEGFREVVNRESAEGASNTPDFVLGYYLLACLIAYESAKTEAERLKLHGLLSVNLQTSIDQSTVHVAQEQK